MYLNRLLSGLTTVIYSTVVDHFEELVYTAETPVKATEYAAVMDTVCAQYKGINEALSGMKYTPFAYAQHVTLTAPGYYLSYATSEIASVGVYVMAQEEGYGQAQQAYIYLQEGVDVTANFATAIQMAKLPSPFEKDTYVDLRKVFLGK